ncbi:MAG TPA: MBL fold metallo-hydrolase, partial [Acidimicrobiales bacterium]|nr:MBL fold metallo-hydrolase [Acidimicrobiales bacterium]
PGPSSWKAIVRRLKDVDLKVRDVHTVIVTHSHPDHFGGVRRLADATGGVEVVAHSAFRNWWAQQADHECSEIHDLDPADLPDASQHTGSPFPGGQTPWGTRSDFRPQMKRRLLYRFMGSSLARRGMQRFAPPPPTNRVRNGDVMKLAGREWFAVHTPGHTLDHLCLHDPESGVLLSGDHVLPTITPHISGMNSGRDPLRLFFESLDKVAALEGVRQVLPAHGHPFHDLTGRVESIKRHHLERLDVLRRASKEIGGPATVEELSHHLFRPARWGSMAESETFAHLEHLRLAGEAERHERDGVLFYEIAS